MKAERALWKTTVPVIAAGVAALVLVGAVIERHGLFDGLAFAIQRTSEKMPSTAAVPADDIRSGVPILSLYVRDIDLRSPETGLLTHPLEHGAEWERPAYVSYFDRGALQFASQAGIRVHGGKSRENSPVQSFRLYFARKYGATEFRPGLLFSRATEPLRRVVVHNDLRKDLRGMWWHFVNPLAYDIAKQIGALVPETHPARVMLNGKEQGAYVLTEHVTGQPFLDSRFGHRNFSVGDSAETARLWRWHREIPTLTMARVGEEFDVENLTNWFISMLFCATTDSFQGVMLRDESQAEPRWFWLNWDMDHSFMDLYQQAAVPWEHDTFATLLSKRELRSGLVTRMLQDDPRYARYFKEKLGDALNHRLTSSFLLERFDYYARIAQTLGVPDTDYLPVLAGFLTRRAAALRALAPQHLSGGESFRAELVAPQDVQFDVDGFPARAGYEGWYFSGTSVRVSVSAADRDRFVRWVVNGRASETTPVLRIDAREDVRIEAVFR